MDAPVVASAQGADADTLLSAVRSDRDFDLAVAHLEDVVRRFSMTGGNVPGSGDALRLHGAGESLDLSQQHVQGSLTGQLRAAVERVVLEFVPVVDGVGREPDRSALDDETNRIKALEAALASLDRSQWDARDKLYRELFEVRGRRIDRGNEQNWKKLEQLVGHKLGR